MFKFTLAALALLGTTLAYPLDIEDVFEDESGQQYAIVPIEVVEQHRVRRQTNYGYGSSGAFLSHKQTLFNNDNHRVDGSAFAQRHFVPKGPLTTGQNIDYTHKNSNSVFSLGTTNTRGRGTDLSASGQYNFLKSSDGKATLGAYGQYNRHFHGPGGTQHPQGEVGLRGTVNFD